MSEPAIYEKHVAGNLVAKFQASAEGVVKIDALLQELGCPCIPGGNSRSVFVCAVLDQDNYDERVRTRGALPLTERTFPSAKAASTHFGYHWNAVLQALQRAGQRGEDTATVAGLQVQWLDQLPGLK